MEKDLIIAIQELRNSIDTLCEVQEGISRKMDKVIMTNSDLDREISFFKQSVNDLVTALNKRL